MKPMFYYIRRREHPLWTKYIKWINGHMDDSEYFVPSDGYTFYGYDGFFISTRKGFNCYIEDRYIRDRMVEISLEEWEKWFFTETPFASPIYHIY